ncbi:uncharacterized protein LOC111625590 isoform X2 [Centruroides sculpturatus]|uniref:uncharacterized protein LOC111625590 isoform X2 n=1 Tax=Centruroides sculpturatus TaxID=218467 RepID=UPI000C6E031F|nr:uncharacterized protein LOC111625590 isoform X2 [Centruroides sculpturatus]
MLHEISAGSKDKTEIIDICEKLLKAVKLESDGGNEETEHKILNAPIHLGKMAEEFETRSEEVKSIWMKQRDPISNLGFQPIVFVCNLSFIKQFFSCFSVK